MSLATTPVPSFMRQIEVAVWYDGSIERIGDGAGDIAQRDDTHGRVGKGYRLGEGQGGKRADQCRPAVAVAAQHQRRPHPLAALEDRVAHRLLELTGVIVAAGCGAVVTLMLSMAHDARVHSMLFWLMGDASAAGRPWPALALLLFAVLACLPLARDLNVLARGALGARALGVAVERLRLAIYLLASLLTATAVTMIGTVGFVGLIVPHLVRLAIGNDQRVLLPASALAGGALLVAADTAARLVLSPLQLPVGVLTALIGVPVFLFLLGRHYR